MSRRSHIAIRSRAALSLAIGLASASAQAESPPPALYVPAWQDIGSFTSRLVTVQNDAVVRLYEGVLRASYADLPRREREAKVRDRLDHPPARDMGPREFRYTIAAGKFAGEWTFFSPEGSLPTRAWQDIDRSDAKGYAAERIGHCHDDADACATWFATGRDRAPRPRPAAPQRAWDAWTRRVTTEACTPQSEYKPGMTAPLSYALQHEDIDQAKLVLRLTLNPCGEVRDARIAKSSGSRALDAATLPWAMRMVLPSAVTDTGGHGVVGLVPIAFDPSSTRDDDADTGAPVPSTAP